MIKEITEHLEKKLIPFWEALEDTSYGGFYGWMDYNLKTDQKAVKGCILNSRITWFFSNAYLTLGDEKLLECARHGFRFLKDACLDQKNGGVYWSVTYDGKPEDTTKHTYNQAFSVYALSAYYEASQDQEALDIASGIYDVIEAKCRDAGGYLEALDRNFHPVVNDKLSENGVIADRTMNTLLHVLEAYTEFCRISGREDVREKLREILLLMKEKIYNPQLRRLDVFFDREYRPLIDLHSYGHDIEASWLMDRASEVIGDPDLTAQIDPMTEVLRQEILNHAFDGHSVPNECERGVVDTDRVWWVQAEALVGFLNGYQKDKEKKEYLKAAGDLWDYIRGHLIDPREGSEWFWLLKADGTPYEGRPIVEPWKCPYHNGRMCMEVIRRKIDAT